MGYIKDIYYLLLSIGISMEWRWLLYGRKEIIGDEVVTKVKSVSILQN